MSLAQGYFDRLQELVGEVKSSYERLNKLQSIYDKKVSTVYHDVEMADLSKEGIGQELALRLQHTLHERRAVKDELKKVQTIHRIIGREMPTIADQYRKVADEGFEIRSSLNSNLPVEEVLASLAE